MANVQPNQTRPKTDPRTEFTRLYDDEMLRVYRYICCHVGNRQEAEDVTTAAFLQGVRRWPSLPTWPASPRAWLFAMASQCLLTHLRHAAPRPAASLERFDLPDEQRKGAVAMLLVRLQRLAERDRVVLTLRFAAGLNPGEIGAVLGIGADAAAVALLRALRRLYEAYQDGLSPAAPVALEHPGEDRPEPPAAEKGGEQ